MSYSHGTPTWSRFRIYLIFCHCRIKSYFFSYGKLFGYPVGKALHWILCVRLRVWDSTNIVCIFGVHIVTYFVIYYMQKCSFSLCNLTALLEMTQVMHLAENWKRLRSNNYYVHKHSFSIWCNSCCQWSFVDKAVPKHCSDPQALLICGNVWVTLLHEVQRLVMIRWD